MLCFSTKYSSVYFILLLYILIHHILVYSILIFLLYSIVFYSILFYSISFWFIVFFSIKFYFIYSILIYSILYYSILFYSAVYCLHSIEYISRAAVVHLNFRAGSTFPVPVCTVPSSMDRTSLCNKVDAVNASYRLNLLLLKGQICVVYIISTPSIKPYKINSYTPRTNHSEQHSVSSI